MSELCQWALWISAVAFVLFWVRKLAKRAGKVRPEQLVHVEVPDSSETIFINHLMYQLIQRRHFEAIEITPDVLTSFMRLDQAQASAARMGMPWPPAWVDIGARLRLRCGLAKDAQSTEGRFRVRSTVDDALSTFEFTCRFGEERISMRCRKVPEDEVPD